jgi:glycosyltransferase involved in cell wall biosynthesis
MPEKVSVIYSGLDAAPAALATTDAASQEFLNKHKLNGRFILHLGNIEPRKNIAGLIAAFDILRAEDEAGEKRFSDLRLALAGASGWKNRAVYRAWQKSPYRDSIKFLGYVSAAEKEILLRQAAVFAYPSFYEGFGFPPLEAMARGVPVVCSNVSSLPEVAGRAALMVNPYRPAEIRTALELVLTDERLRARMTKAGYEQAARFSWDKTAAEYLALFKSIR